MSTSNGPPRISLAPPFVLRGGLNGRGPVTDAKIVNGYIEKTPEGLVTIKRPCFVLAVLAERPVTGGQGCFVWSSEIFFVTNGRLFFGNSILLGTVGDTLGVLNSGVSRRWSFNSVQGATPRMVLQSASAIHTVQFTGFRPGLTVNVATGHNFLNGSAYLDGTLYLPEGPNNLLGSGLNDPTTWDPLNVIKPQQEPDKIVCVIKQHQYVVVFKQWTTEFFWDAGNPVGSPLQSAQGASIDFGCAFFDTVEQLEDTILWVATSRSGSLSVMMMQNLQAQTVSTPDIERALSGLLTGGNYTGAITGGTIGPVFGGNSLFAWSFRLSGHRFYCLNGLGSYTLVYDLTTQHWFQWTAADGGPLPFIGSTGDPVVGTFFQHIDGSLYRVSSGAFTENGLSIPVDIYGENWDGGTRHNKVLQRAEVLGDQSGMGEAQLRWSDDDYQTWSNYRAIDLSQKRAFIDDLGTFYRRAFHLRYAPATPFRVRGIECTNLMVGSL